MDFKVFSFNVLSLLGACCDVSLFISDSINLLICLIFHFLFWLVRKEVYEYYIYIFKTALKFMGYYIAFIISV